MWKRLRDPTTAEQVKHVDAFDYSENMIERARSTYGEENNRFFHGSVLSRATCDTRTYDAAICVRVLINLRDLSEQITALGNLAYWLKPGAKLILIEGFRDGFDSLNAVRTDCGMPALRPAPINYYSYLDELKGQITSLFEIACDSIQECSTSISELYTLLSWEQNKS